MMVVHAFNVSTGEAETGVSLWVLGWPSLQSEFQDNQDYTEKSQNKTKTPKNKVWGKLILFRMVIGKKGNKITPCKGGDTCL